MSTVHSPKNTPFPLLPVEAGTLIKKLVGEHWLEKARGFYDIFVGAKMQEVRLWLLVQVVGIVNLILPGAGDVFTHVPKVDVILVRTLGLMRCFNRVAYDSGWLLCGCACDPGKPTPSDRSKTCAMSRSIVWKVGACH